MGVVLALLANGLYLALALPVDSVLLYALCLPLNVGLLLALIWFERYEAVRGVVGAIILSLWFGGGCLILLMLGVVLL